MFLVECWFYTYKSLNLTMATAMAMNGTVLLSLSIQRYHHGNKYLKLKLKLDGTGTSVNENNIPSEYTYETCSDDTMFIIFFADITTLFSFYGLEVVKKHAVHVMASCHCRPWQYVINQIA